MPYRNNATEQRDAENAADQLEIELLAREAKRRRLRAALGVFLLVVAADGTLVSAKPKDAPPRLQLQTMTFDVQAAYENVRHVPVRSPHD